VGEGSHQEYLPRAVDKAKHRAENLHHYRVVVPSIILEYVLKLVRLFAPSQLLFSTLLVLIDHHSVKLSAITSDLPPGAAFEGLYEG